MQTTLTRIYSKAAQQTIERHPHDMDLIASQHEFVMSQPDTDNELLARWLTTCEFYWLEPEGETEVLSKARIAFDKAFDHGHDMLRRHVRITESNLELGSFLRAALGIV